MNNPGSKHNNFLSTRSNKVNLDVMNSQNLAGPVGFQGKDQCLSLFYNLIKKKKPAELKKQVSKVKQVVLRSPSNQQRPEDIINGEGQKEMINKENDSKISNISKHHASKILFHDERKLTRYI